MKMHKNKNKTKAKKCRECQKEYSQQESCNK